MGQFSGRVLAFMYEVLGSVPSTAKPNKDKHKDNNNKDYIN